MVDSSEPGAPSSPWGRTISRRLLVTDIAIVVVTVGLAQFIRYSLGWPSPRPGHGPVWDTVVSIVIAGSWIAALSINGSRDRRILGIGSLEYKRVFDATFSVFALLAITSVLFLLGIARGYLVMAFPVGLVLLVVGRWAWRKWLVRRRLAGENLLRSIIVGSPDSIQYMADQLRRFPYAGYKAIGVCLPRAQASELTEVAGLPVLGSFADVATAARSHEADSVILTSSDQLPPATVRRIAWSLETSPVELAVAPALTEIAGPRIHIRQLAGLPLLHVAVPQYEGSKQAAKSVFDVATAMVLGVLLSPVLLVTALVVRVTSAGPVIFRQERVGLNGKTFRMLKFRTMVDGAENRLDELLPLNEGSGPLFKVRDDPRVTPVGRFLRRFSLDELPQLWNVIRGDMSIVGPRPPLPSEVERYEPDVRRRLLVKPGVTGPWQISGRSDLSWAEGVRLDLFYVENWTLFGDLLMIWRTLRVVIRRHGAY
ncbi:sugar transferase [Schumannella luteola]